jgi:hypothetical protein
VCRVERNGKNAKSCGKGEVLSLDRSLLMGDFSARRPMEAHIIQALGNLHETNDVSS